MKQCICLVLFSVSFLFGQEAEQKPPVLSEKLLKIASHLGEGGVHFSVTDTEGDLMAIADVLDSLLGLVPSEEVPEGLSFKLVAKQLGADGVHGSGASSVEREGFWHNRNFVLAPEKRGLLGIAGQKPKKWVAPSFAPAGADVVAEIELDLSQLEPISRGIVKPILEGEDLEEFNAMWEEPVPGTEETVADFVRGFQMRTSMVLWLDEEKRVDMGDGVDFPVPHLVFKIDGASYYWKQFEATLGQVEEMGGRLEKKDGVTTVYFPETPMPWGNWVPKAIYDEKKDELWIATDQGDLDLCLKGGDKLVDDGPYQKIMAGIPSEGQAQFYVSGQMFEEMKKALMIGRQFVGDHEDAQLGITMVDRLMELFESKNGYAGGFSIVPDGFLFASNMPMANKSSSQFGGLSTIGSISVLTGLATPAIFNALEAGELTKETHNLKQLSISLLMYDQQFGNFPDRLEDLVKEGIMSKKQLEEMETGSFRYVPGYSTSDHAQTVIAYTLEPRGGKHALLRLDGSVKQMLTTIEELEDKVAQQQKK